MSKIRDAWKRRQERKRLDSMRTGPRAQTIVIDESQSIPEGILASEILREVGERGPERTRLVAPGALVPAPSVTVIHRGDPRFSKARRERNKARRLAKLHGNSRSRLPHGRQVKPHADRVHQARPSSDSPAQRV